jgi:transposase
MKRRYFIGLDAHCQSCDLAVVNASGKLVRRLRCRTTIPNLVEFLNEVRRPRCLTFEEGFLAGWLSRHLREHVDQLLVCEPRRNRLIAHDGDKDDDIDAEKLAQLFRGGYLKEVHHAESLERAAFKQLVLLHHDRVRARVREGNRALAYVRGHGIFVREGALSGAEARADLYEQLPKNDIVRDGLRVLLQSYDLLSEQEEEVKRRLEQRARLEDVIKRWYELPGIGWIRAATLFVGLDTPWRFASKEALWRYLGIGLERRGSGSGPMHVRVAQNANRMLKSAILGAALSASVLGDNPFADQHRKWVENGVSPLNARRNVARSQAAVMWGMWKNGSVYHPEWVGVSMAAQAAVLVSA